MKTVVLVFIGTVLSLAAIPTNAQHPLQLDNGVSYSLITGSTPGGNYLLPPGGGTLIVMPPPGSPGLAWFTAGNGSTTPETHFLGTTDNTAFHINVRNAATITNSLIFGANGSLSRELTGVIPGNPRGVRSVDLQSLRSAATQVAGGDYSTIAGGNSNSANGGGGGNSAINTVGGGTGNSANGAAGSNSGINTIGGGSFNSANGNTGDNSGYNTVAGGTSNSTTGGTAGIFSGHNTIGGGSFNNASGGGDSWSGINTISGGQSHQAMGNSAFNSGGNSIGGGWSNTANGSTGFGSGYNTIAGGYQNIANGSATGSSGFNTVGGGYSNDASPAGGLIGYNTIGGGNNNTASGQYSTVIGGINNTASAYASIAGGDNTVSSSVGSIALGTSAIASTDYAFARGFFVTSNGMFSSTQGYWTTASAPNAHVLGNGNSNLDRLTNGIPSSLMIGFNSNAPTLFVSGSAGGSTLGFISAGGTTASNGNVRLVVENGHVQSRQTTAPAIAAGPAIAGAGTAATMANHTDVAGQISVTSGNTPAIGVAATVTFNMTYAIAPIVVITATNANGAGMQTFVTTTATGFDVNFVAAPTTGETYTYTYHVIETQ